MQPTISAQGPAGTDGFSLGFAFWGLGVRFLWSFTRWWLGTGSMAACLSPGVAVSAVHREGARQPAGQERARHLVGRASGSRRVVRVWAPVLGPRSRVRLVLGPGRGVAESGQEQVSHPQCRPAWQRRHQAPPGKAGTSGTSAGPQLRPAGSEWHVAPTWTLLESLVSRARRRHQHGPFSSPPPLLYRVGFCILGAELNVEKAASVTAPCLAASFTAVG